MGNKTSINEGPVICNTFDTTASFADSFSCFLFQIPYKLDAIKFGQINFVLLLIIITISLFGRIKLHYRWFILNMCLIDLFTCWDFICEKGFYQSAEKEVCYFGYFDNIIRYNTFMFARMPCIGLFILTGSRFLNLYFSNVYKKFEKTWKIILAILLIDFTYIFISVGSYFLLSKYTEETQKCLPWITNYPNFTYGNLTCNHKIPDNEAQCIAIARENFYYSCDKETKAAWNWAWILTRISPAITPIAMILSTIFVAFLILKVGKQIKLSAKVNPAMLKTNIRIVIVFSVQTLLLLFLFLFDSVDLLQDAVSFKQSFPPWLKWLTYEHGTVASFREIRIFIDSLIILAFMSGYREDLIALILWFFRSSKNTWKKANKKIFTDRATVVSLY